MENSSDPKKEPQTKDYTSSDGKITVKKKSELSKFVNNFFASDAKSVKDKVIWDVVVPGIKKVFTDSVNNGLNWLFHGTKGNPPKTGSGNISFIPYNSINDSSLSGSRQCNLYTVNDVEFESEEQAVNTLRLMREQIKSFHECSVADYYDICRFRHDYTDRDYGWTNLDNAVAYSKHGKWALDLPKVSVLTHRR